jgi:hypothetical protein
VLRGKMDNSRVSSYLRNTTKTDDGCLVWNGNSSQGDHGRASYAVAEIHGEKFYVHRYVAFASYEDAVRELLWKDKTIQIMHSCDVKLCINPDHLSIGDQSANMLDAIAKGIKVMPRGSAHPRAKLDEDSVVVIRKAYREGYSQWSHV